MAASQVVVCLRLVLVAPASAGGSSSHVTSCCPLDARLPCALYSACSLPLIRMAVCIWGPSIVSSFVTSVISGSWLILKMRKFRRLRCSVGSLARSAHAAGVGCVVCSIGGGGSGVSDGGCWVLHGAAAGGSAVWLANWFTGYSVKCSLGLDGGSSGV